MDTSLQNEEIDESDSNLNEITSNSPHNSNDNENKSEVLDEINDQCHKSTFKNVLQAKKRLQAFSVQKQIPISSSTSKTKLKTVFVSEKTYNEKGEIQENLVPLRKPPKKADNPIDKAKAVIEEIELLKKIELLGTTPLTIEEKLMSMSAPKRSRSRSKSSERDFVFRKREKKVRNYRRSDSGRRSPSPLLTKTREKPSEKSSRYKYPKNWDEFFKEKWTFEKLFSKMSHPSGRNNIPSDITRQLLFKTPAEVIKPFYYKNEKGEEISVPYKFLRHTLVEPKIPYNCNQVKFKEQFLTREQTLSNTHKNYRMYLEKFLERSNRTKFRTTEPIGQRNWYQKCWKDNETKVLESSIGLSFLQNYSDDDDEEEEVDQVQLTEMESIVVKKEENKKKTDGNNTKEYIKNEEDAKIKVRDRCSEKKKEEVSFPDHGENISKYSKTDQKMTEITTVSFIEGEIERNAEKSKSVHEEELDKKDVITSWTPERIVPTIIDQWDEMPKKKKDKSTQDVKKNKKQIDTNCQNIEEKQKAREIYSEDEWDETPTRKKEKSISEEADVKKFKKKKNRKKSVSESSSSEEKKKTKKKRKLDKKKKQKEKEKKARKKKEKLKAEKLKQKKEKKKKLKLKEREAEKEILKKLKKEIENSLVEVEREEREKIEINKSEQIADPPIRVKVEKEDSYEQTRRPVEDLRNFLDKKIGKTRGKIEEKTSDIEKHTEIDEGRDERKNKRMNKISVIKDWKKQAKVKEEKCNENNDKYNLHFNMEKTVENREEEFSLEKRIIDSPKFNISNKTGVYVESQQNPANSAQETAESSEKEPAKPKLKSEKELTGETTPDTDEYHSNWESDDGISPIVKMDTKKADRSWESDEEIFERSYSKKDQGNIPLGESPLLEMPLHIKKFSRRNFDRRESKGSRSRTRSPEYLDVDSEIKLLEEERINLSKERMRLEIERIRIHELERKKSMEEIEYINEGEKSPTWSARNFRKKQDKRQSRWDLKDDHVDSSTSKHRREKSVERHSRCEEDKTDISYGPHNVLSISSSPEITSTKSPIPNVLENAYQEFMKAVSVGEDSKDFLVISSTESERPDLSARNQKKNRLTRSERDKNREKNARTLEKKKENENTTIVGTTDPKLLQEILLPGEVPLTEIPMPMPMPVPSPKVDILQNLTPIPVLNVTTTLPRTIPMPDPIVEPNAPQEPTENPQKNLELTPTKKAFSFSTLKLSKKPVLLEKSNWKVEDDSEEDLPPAKKGLDDIRMEHENPMVVIKKELEEKSGFLEDSGKKIESASKHMEETIGDRKVEERREDKMKDVKERDRRKEDEDRRRDERPGKRRHSRSRSPVETYKEKRRKEDDIRRREELNRRREIDNRRKEEDDRRKQEDIRRRDRGKNASSPHRHREPSPRRRRLSSPVYRRSSPRHRSPLKREDSSRRLDRSDRSRSSPTRKRRSQSPTKQISVPRRRSPRWSKSPGHSPVDGLKRSVADSTISDDLLPQPYMGESSNSPLCSSTPMPPSRRSKITLSPKRLSLDERISQVLGIEPQPQETWKHMEHQEYTEQQSMVYSGYQHHLPAMETPSSMITTSKVVQVGNILQVVPTEDISMAPPVMQSSSVQKIVQVGNMLQIVPTEMDVVLPPLPPPPPPKETQIPEKIPLPVPLPEKQSAETIFAAKNSEKMAERARKRQEKEDRKKEKEKKKKEKDRRRKMRLKISTEEIIKRALELDGFIENENEDLNVLVPEIISDSPGLDPSKSILLNSASKYLENVMRREKRKSVQFADGVRPGEGTSPSGGEELSSPPPQTEDLPKPKKYRKMEVPKKKKRKIKVKVIKKRQPSPDSDEEYENLPPPSPPPGSPPSHLFPSRVKVHTINNIPQHYLPAFGLTTAPQQPILNQPPPALNVGYQIPSAGVYRAPPPPPSTHVAVVGQHYARTGHAQPIGGPIQHPPTQHMHPHGTTPISHHQQYGAF